MTNPILTESVTPQGKWSTRVLLELLKPVTWFPPMWAFLCGAVSAGIDITAHPLTLIAGLFLAGPLLCGASQVINDWHDREVDLINEPQRPIPSGRAPGRTALYFAFIWSALAFLWSIPFGVWVVSATTLGLILAWAYSAPPLRLKRNGWFGNAAVGISYEGLAWIAGAALFLNGAMPSPLSIAAALLFSFGAHGIMTLNDFKSINGDLKIGIGSLPAQLGVHKAAVVAGLMMLAPQIVVIGWLLSSGFIIHLGILSLLVLGQGLAFKRLLQDPKRYAPWYNGTGVLAYVTGMMVTAHALSTLTP